MLLLLEAVHRHYGYDFRNYAPASLRRRIRQYMALEQIGAVSGVQQQVLHDPAAMERLLLTLTVGVTEMFRDPGFFLAVRRKVAPLLADLPLVRIWHVGCSTGEEVYSMTILLHEEGLGRKSRLYATDLSDLGLSKARAGIFPLAAMQTYSQNYVQAGGQASLSEYYTAGNDAAIFRAWLRSNIIFAQHNLVTDRSFNEFHVILCRNVLIYFDKPLREHVHRLLYESLAPGGILGLGAKESIDFTPHEAGYEVLDSREKLYRKAG